MQLPWQTVEPLDDRSFSQVKLAAIFDCCKWDPQVEDVCTLSPIPLVLTSLAWQELVLLAEKLANETIAAETAILQKPHLLKRLGLPWALRWRFPDAEAIAAQNSHLRLIRFDFHFTTEGWRISEANSDVPGGFNEASGFSKLMAEHYRDAAVSGDPAEKMCNAISTAINKTGTVALLHATSFADDRQVMTFLRRRLEAAGHKAVLASPDHLRWEEGHAHLAADWANGPVDFCFRFFPAEWLPALPRRCRWWHLLGDSQTPLCNPALAIISQSKRFPLIWDELPIRLPTWEKLLPKTFDVREMSKRGLREESVVFKPALGRVGDMIKMSGLNTEKEARKINRLIQRYPQHWIAQQRFEALPLSSADGDVYPCIGIYTLDGVVIGAYGRAARRPLINHLAQDMAVLIAEPVADPIQPQSMHHDSSRAL